MSDVEDEIRASLVADLSLSYVLYHDAEQEVDDLIKKLKDEWAHGLAERIRNRANGEPEGRTWLLEAADAIDPKAKK